MISANFTIVNKCNYTVWPASTLSGSGFVLKPGETSTITIPAKWDGFVWGRTLCTTDSTTAGFSCITGDCGTGKVKCEGRGSPPATLAKFRLNGPNNQDFYDISILDGYNIPMEVVPSTGKCNNTSCPVDLNMGCPTKLKVTQNGTVVACKSSCRGNCNETSADVNVKIFKTACPQAYILTNDVKTFSCSHTDYQVVFCPASSNVRLENTLMSFTLKKEIKNFKNQFIFVFKHKLFHWNWYLIDQIRDLNSRALKPQINNTALTQVLRWAIN